MTPPKDYLEDWPQFMEAVRVRMERGRETYGDKSFLRAPDELAGEVEEELLDVAGWSFVLWNRIRELRNKIKANHE